MSTGTGPVFGAILGLGMKPFVPMATPDISPQRASRVPPKPLASKKPKITKEAKKAHERALRGQTSESLVEQVMKLMLMQDMPDADTVMNEDEEVCAFCLAAVCLTKVG